MKSTTIAEPDMQVLFGANAVQVTVVPGTNIAKIRMDLSRHFSMPAGVPAMIDGVPASDSTKISLGTQTVEFLQPAGEKG